MLIFTGQTLRAAAVERGSEWQVAVFSRVEGRIDDQADRPGIGRAVAQPSAAPIDRAGVHAGAAADAFKRGPELRPCRGAAERPLSTSTTCISPPLSGPRKCEVYWVIGEPSALRDNRRMNTAKMLQPRDDLLDADRGDMQLRHVGRQIGIAFVGADDEARRFPRPRNCTPVIPASAARISGRVASRCAFAR